ncbi:hypothetical protein CVT26_002724 [Gymnopilus dilepis]|uniref:Uncharacterized protein n=1 Tax=Gymnopilus dilepis TaxID=231916 RepID=A0A409Y369_9AGAR|nr:hypothetical protein CVT26_002724 [Gymnopilus dilepis]
MQFNVVFVATALFASAPLAMAATITGFSGPGCTGTQGQSLDVPSGECFRLPVGSSPVVSIQYSGVPNEIAFFVPGGREACLDSPSLILGAGSGCGTAPAG